MTEEHRDAQGLSFPQGARNVSHLCESRDVEFVGLGGSTAGEVRAWRTCGYFDPGLRLGCLDR